MSGYIMPPRLRPSDYIKGKITQDDLLRVAIANDANIAKARKDLKLGEIEQITPIDNLSPEEKLRDEAQQEADARMNLERLGFRSQEASNILSELNNDQRKGFNAGFPAIEKDIKKQYDVKLLTPTFFIEYLRKYLAVLFAAKGLKYYEDGGGIGTANEELVNNVDELSRILPSETQLKELINLAKPLNNDVITDKLKNIRDSLPNFNILAQLNAPEQYSEIQRLLMVFRNVPTNEQIQLLLNNARYGDPKDVMNTLIDVAFAGNEEMARVSNTKSYLKQDIDDEADDTLNPIFSKDEVAQMRREIVARNLQSQVRLNSNPNINPNITRILAKKDADNSRGWYYIGDTNLLELLETEGKGLKTFKAPKMKIGRGISVKALPSYREFGKYVIHLPQLENQDILNVKYKSLGQIPQFKPLPVSDVLKDFILDLLDTGKVNKRVYETIEEKERQLFENIAVGAGIWNSLGLDRTISNQDKNDLNRFELLRGEFIAGNNNPQVLQELRKLVIKFMHTGKIPKSKGLELLMELSV